MDNLNTPSIISQKARTAFSVGTGQPDNIIVSNLEEAARGQRIIAAFIDGLRFTQPQNTLLTTYYNRIRDFNRYMEEAVNRLLQKNAALIEECRKAEELRKNIITLREGMAELMKIGAMMPKQKVSGQKTSLKAMERAFNKAMGATDHA